MDMVMLQSEALHAVAIMKMSSITYYVTQ